MEKVGRDKKTTTALAYIHISSQPLAQPPSALPLRSEMLACLPTCLLARASPSTTTTTSFRPSPPPFSLPHAFCVQVFRSLQRTGKARDAPCHHRTSQIGDDGTRNILRTPQLQVFWGLGNEPILEPFFTGGLARSGSVYELVPSRHVSGQAILS